ncbi:Putative uncharacterized protein [Halomonas sp. R57-5]|nr:Putative uncharacterized protein [Halomonas sp. R57-5]
MISMVSNPNSTRKMVNKVVKNRHSRKENHCQSMRLLLPSGIQLSEAIFFVDKSDMHIPMHPNRDEVEPILSPNT